MRFNVFNKPIHGKFVVIDSVFPQKEPSAFRNAEINEYFRRIPAAESYTMYPMQPGPEAWFTHSYGMTKELFDANKRGYARHYPQNKQRVHQLDPKKNYQFKLAYSFFLSETYVLLPFFEKHSIPFVFVLYPGGSFGLNNKKSDDMLRRIFSSPCFRSVIVTQQITRDYLVQKKLCPARSIAFIYGGFVQFKKEDVQPKKYYKQDKQTFDICFVAAKYTEQGVDKGYDLFIETAKKLCKTTDDIMFHVIGNFDENDIDVSGIRPRITFYGYKGPDSLRDLYAGMDIFLGPNRPFKIYKGNFDGFPLGIDSGYCGVALFVGDELKMNHYYKPDKEIVIVPPNAAKIAEKALHYYNDLEAFYDLSKKGQVVTQKLFDIDHQIDERMKVFKKFVSWE